MPLLAVCRCGTEADSAEFRAGRCRPCQAAAACAVDRSELGRLWRKRERYTARAISHLSIDRQAARLEDRIRRRCQEIDPDLTKAAALAQRQYDQVRATVSPARLVLAR